MPLYVITDGDNHYIRRGKNGKFTSVCNRVMADEFSELWKAKKVLTNNVNPKHRKRFYILEDDFSELEDKSAKKNIDELKEKLIRLRQFISDNNQRKNKLNDLLSNVDKEITDIQHYIELNDLDDNDCLRIYKLLKKKFKIRRDIKNEFYILMQLDDCKMEEGSLEELLKIMSKFDEKKYIPRVLKELF